MSKDGKPVTKHLVGVGNVTSYEDVPDAREARLNAPLPEKKVAPQGEAKSMVGDEYHLRPATAEELRAATAGAIASRMGQGSQKTASAADVVKSIVSSVEAVQKAGHAKKVAVTGEDAHDGTAKQDEVSESDEEESLKPEGVKNRDEHSGTKPKKVKDAGNAPENAPYGVRARVNGQNKAPTVAPKKKPSHYGTGAPADGTKTPMKQPTTKKSLEVGDKVYVPAVKSTMTITELYDNDTAEVTDGRRSGVVHKSDLMPIVKHETLVAHDHNAITAGDVPIYTGEGDDTGNAGNAPAPSGTEAKKPASEQATADNADESTADSGGKSEATL